MPSSEAFRPSPQQRRAWLSQPEGESDLARGVVSIEGDLDAERLRAALARVVERHEILRTRFTRLPGVRVPFQVIEPLADFSWETFDAGTEGVGGPEAADRLASRRPPTIDPERGPVLAAELARLGAGSHALLLTLSTLCADAATLEHLLAAIADAYAGEGGPEPEIFQYADYAEWQNELLESSEPSARAARDSWQERGLAATAAPSLAFEKPGAAAAPERKEIAALLLPPDLVARSNAVAAAQEAAPEDLWLACWLALLARRSGSAAPWVAVRFGGREHAELAGALGLFARWLPVAVPCVGETPFSDLLARLAKAIREVEEVQQFYPCDCEAQKAPAAGAVGFELDERPAPRTAGGVRFSLVGRSVTSERCKLLLSCTLTAGGLEARLSYDPGRFEERDVARLADELRTLCRDALARPEQALGGLELLDEEERRRLLVDFNRTQEDFGPPRCVHELIAEAAAGAPDRVAVCCEGRSLTYRELEWRANQLARYLTRLGVGPDLPVVLCLERSVEAIVALLAVWKAGGAYVPLDPQQPRRRLAQVLEDVDPPVVLTLGDFAVPGTGRVVRLDVDEGEIAREDGSPFASGATAASLAYVIFTSGSTGRPKGVCVEHRQLHNYVESARRRLDLPAGGSFATVSTLSADLGHTSIFPALCTGGTLHILSLEEATDAKKFRDHLERNAVDCLKIVPSHLQALQEGPEPERVLPRRRLILGGEASPREWALGLAATDPDCLVFNHYGPSETTVGVLTFPVRPGGIDPRAATAPLGRPIPNAAVFLLDREGAPVPAWAAGEVYIGGAGVARGYLGRPDLTAERFVPDGLSGSCGARLYRTGDLARHLPDGVVEFLGRIDHQVKFHGFRVELNEIRGALNEHAQIRDSVVAKLRDGQGREALVAYYVARQPLEVGELRLWLAASIPEETIPNVFVHLRRLPLTLNGKVNLEALPSLDEVREKLERRFVPPRDATEERLAAIWSDVLGLARVGIEDNFFELGGHSLLATRVVSRVRQALAIEMPLRGLFEAPTIAGLALHIAEGRFPALERTAPLAPRVAAGPTGLEEQLAELERLSDQEAKELLGGA